MSGYNQDHYEDGYDHQAQGDSYYQDGYYDQQNEYSQQGDGHYDRAGYYNADASNPYQQDGGYYEGGQQNYQDDYYNDQFYDQGNAGNQGYAQGRGRRRAQDSEDDSETFSDFTMRSETARAADMDTTAGAMRGTTATMKVRWAVAAMVIDPHRHRSHTVETGLRVPRPLSTGWTMEMPCLLVSALGNPTQPGPPNPRYPCRRKRLKISSWIW
jgi:hypothetical protein